MPFYFLISACSCGIFDQLLSSALPVPPTSTFSRITLPTSKRVSATASLNHCGLRYSLEGAHLSCLPFQLLTQVYKTSSPPFSLRLSFLSTTHQHPKCFSSKHQGTHWMSIADQYHPIVLLISLSYSPTPIPLQHKISPSQSPPR